MPTLIAKSVKSNSLQSALKRFASCIFGSFRTVNGHSLCGSGDIIVSPRGSAAIAFENVEAASGSLPAFSKLFSYVVVFDTSSKRLCLKAVNKSTKAATYYAAWPGMEAVCDSSGNPWPDVVYVADGQIWLWDGSDLKPLEQSGGSGVEIARLGGLMFDPVSGQLGVAFDNTTLKVNKATGLLYVDLSGLNIPAASDTNAGLMSVEDKAKIDSLATTYAAKDDLTTLSNKVDSTAPRPAAFNMNRITIVKPNDPLRKEEASRWYTVPPDFDIAASDIIGFEELYAMNATEIVFVNSSSGLPMYCRPACQYVDTAGDLIVRLLPVSDSLGRIYIGVITVREDFVTVRWQLAPYTYVPAE